MFELGNNLREARQRRRIDLVIAEQDTKIRSKYLAALETEDFDVLPGPVFVRGFLRTYSRYLGLDAQLFVDEYNARFGRFEEIDDHASPALGRPGLAQERDRRGRRTMRSLVVLSLVGIAVLAWSGLRAQDERPAVEDRTAEASQPVEAPETTSTVQRGAFDQAAKAAGGTPAAPRTTTPRATTTSADTATAKTRVGTTAGTSDADAATTPAR
jgi:cytoskeletal protein RodZ